MDNGNKTLAVLFLGLLIVGGAMAGFSGDDASSTPGISVAGAYGKISLAVWDNHGELVGEYVGPNVVTNAGLDHIKYLVSTGQGTDAMKYISLGNATAPDATSTTLASEWVTCGLSRATGTVYDIGTGNWTVSADWTSTCDGVKVNTSGMFNATSGATMYAGENFNTYTLDNGFTLQLNWTAWVV